MSRLPGPELLALERLTPERRALERIAPKHLTPKRPVRLRRHFLDT